MPQLGVGWLCINLVPSRLLLCLTTSTAACCLNCGAVLSPLPSSTCQGLLWETSLLDAEEGIRFRGYSIPELQVGAGGGRWS
jgi:hypothetical protein